MIQKEVQKLSLGLYEIFWKSCGSSLASVGNTREGIRWLAPCNWLNSGGTGYWHLVKSVKLIKAA